MIRLPPLTFGFVRFSIWLARTVWKLKKQDREPICDAINRWIDWEEDWDRRSGKVDVKNIHQTLLQYLPMGAGYVFLVSQSQAKDYRSVDVEITFSSNLDKTQALELLNSTERTLIGKNPIDLKSFWKKDSS